MSAAKTLLICKSVHHQNTARVAQRMAGVLGAVVAAPEDVPYASLNSYDLIGFGSGVYYGRVHETLSSWLTKLPAHALSAKPAFLFTTSGLSCLWKLWHAPFKKELAKKGFDVVGEFHCRGFDSWGPLWLTGGINRRHPDEQDLRRAAEFADRMQLAMRTQPAHKSLIEQPVSRAGE